MTKNGVRLSFIKPMEPERFDNPPAGAEWGRDLSVAVSEVSSNIWWTGVYPGLAIVLIVVGVTLVGESLNDVLNPLLRTAKVDQVTLPARGEDA